MKRQAQGNGMKGIKHRKQEQPKLGIRNRKEKCV
jgi:hypothetical protein